jgi:hypothetical protein
VDLDHLIGTEAAERGGRRHGKSPCHRSTPLLDDDGSDRSQRGDHFFLVLVLADHRQGLGATLRELLGLGDPIPNVAVARLALGVEESHEGAIRQVLVRQLPSVDRGGLEVGDAGADASSASGGHD